MSRYTKKAADKLLVYGTDHALGYFFEEWLQVDFESDDDLTRPFSEKCQMFGMKQSELLDRLHQYRCKPEHIKAVEQNQGF
jgi:hypothetical protein